MYTSLCTWCSLQAPGVSVTLHPLSQWPVAAPGSWRSLIFDGRWFLSALALSGSTGVSSQGLNNTSLPRGCCKLTVLSSWEHPDDHRVHQYAEEFKVRPICVCSDYRRNRDLVWFWQCLSLWSCYHKEVFMQTSSSSWGWWEINFSQYSCWFHLCLPVWTLEPLRLMGTAVFRTQLVWKDFYLNTEGIRRLASLCSRRKEHVIGR